MKTQAYVLQDPMADHEFADWGEIPEMLEGSSRTFGKMLYRRQDGSSESGIWNCTPGTWKCHVTKDEFCHFLAGCCTYTSESGQVIEVKPGTIAFFPQGWNGVCEVRETIRKVYMIRQRVQVMNIEEHHTRRYFVNPIYHQTIDDTPRLQVINPSTLEPVGE